MNLNNQPASRPRGLIVAAMERARELDDRKRAAALHGQPSTAAAASEHVEMPAAPAGTTISAATVQNAAEAAETPHKRKRQAQHVVSKQERLQIIKWMVNANNDDMKFLLARTIKQFPECFRAASSSANFMKVSRWWSSRADFLAACEDPAHRLSIQASQPGIRRKVLLKALPGRGWKRDPWTEWLQLELLDEFHRLRKAGIKISPSLLLTAAMHLLSSSDHPHYSRTFVPPVGLSTFYDRLNVRWVQSFQERFNIVQRKQTGKKQLSPEKELFIEKEVAYHLGLLKRGFASGEFVDTHMENMDETHFIIDMDNGKTLSVKGDETIRYADVVSGTTGMTMVVHVTGGRSSCIGLPMMMFINPDCNYPIRGVPDNIPGVAYRSAKKGFMTSTVFLQWLAEKRVHRKKPGQRKTMLWLDNYSGHAQTDAVVAQLRELNIELRYFPSNSTHLLQPADSFVISKIKDAWLKRWDEKKIDMVKRKEWQNEARTDGSWSRALRNPGKSFFLQLGADAVRDVNAQRTKKKNITYAQKAMIRCGLACNNRVWSTDQLSEELQRIVVEHNNHFLGEPVAVCAASQLTDDQEAFV